MGYSSQLFFGIFFVTRKEWDILATSFLGYFFVSRCNAFNCLHTQWLWQAWHREAIELNIAINEEGHIIFGEFLRTKREKDINEELLQKMG